jgi:hypothetical protein
MVEGPNQKNLTIDLHIKTLCIKVSEHTPVHVIWSRGIITKVVLRIILILMV